MSSNSVADAHSLTIEYALTRSEIFRSFRRGIAKSPRFRNTILPYSIVIGLITPIDSNASFNRLGREI